LRGNPPRLEGQLSWRFRGSLTTRRASSCGQHAEHARAQQGTKSIEPYLAWLLPPFPQGAHRTLRLPHFIPRVKFSMIEMFTTRVTRDDTALSPCTSRYTIPLQAQILGRHRRQHRLQRGVGRGRRIFGRSPQRKLSLEIAATCGGRLRSRKRT